MATDLLDTVLRHGQVGFAIAVVDRHGFGLHDCEHVLVGAQPLQAFAHAVERPEQVGSCRPRLGQFEKVLFQRLLPVIVLGQALTQRKHQPIRSTDADGSRTAHRHVADRLDHGCHIGASQPVLAGRQQTLVEQMQGAITPLDAGHLLRRQKSLAHRLSPQFTDQKRTIIASLGRRRSGILRVPLNGTR